MEDVQTYILARTAGKTAKRPKATARTDTQSKTRTAKRTAR